MLRSLVAILTMVILTLLNAAIGTVVASPPSLPRGAASMLNRHRLAAAAERGPPASDELRGVARGNSKMRWGASLWGRHRRRYHRQRVQGVVPRGGAMAPPAAYADFYDEGLYSDGGGGGSDNEVGSGEPRGGGQGFVSSPHSEHEAAHQQQQQPGGQWQQPQEYFQQQQQVTSPQNRPFEMQQQRQQFQSPGTMLIPPPPPPTQFSRNPTSSFLALAAAASRMDATTVALALRLGCEVNRRLHYATAAAGTAARGGEGRESEGSSALSRRHLHMDLVDDDDGEGDYGTATGQIGMGHDADADRQQWGDVQQQHSPPPPPPQHSYQTPSGPVPVHLQHSTLQQQQQPWNAPPIRRADPDVLRSSAKPPLTVFHALRPRPDPPARKSRRRGNESRQPRPPRTGTKRWGPDLEQYLLTLCKALECEDDPAVLARALIYLDRSCSVETERGPVHHQWEAPPPCPTLAPRTVHRLVLTAIVLSCRTVRGEASPEYDGAYAGRLEQFGMSGETLSVMERTMRDALGFEGLAIDEYRLIRYLIAWGETFTVEDNGGPLPPEQQERGDDSVDGRPAEWKGGPPPPPPPPMDQGAASWGGQFFR